MRPVAARIEPDGRDMLAARMPTAINGEQDVAATFSEVFDSALGLVRREGTSISADLAFEPHVQERNQKIEELTGVKADFIDQTRYLDPAVTRRIEKFIDAGEIFQNEDGSVHATSRIADFWMKDNAQLTRVILATQRARRLSPAEVPTDKEIDRRVSAELAEKRAPDEEILSRGRGVSGVAGALSGTFVGALQDPILLASLPFGFGPMLGRGVAINAGRAFLAEGLAAGVSEIPIQAEVMRFKKQINSPYSTKEAAFNVLAATLGAGLLRATGSITVDVAENALKAYRGRFGGIVETPESREAAQALQAYVDQANESPVGPTLRTKERERDHFEAIDKAASDIEAGRPVRVGDLLDDDIPVTARILPQETVQNAIARLIPDAGNALTRGERKAIVSEISDLKFKLDAIKTSREPLRAEARRIEKQLPATLSKKARETQALKRASEARKQETELLENSVAALQERMRMHDEANLAKATLDRVDRMRATGKTEDEIQKVLEEKGLIQRRKAGPDELLGTVAAKAKEAKAAKQKPRTPKKPKVPEKAKPESGAGKEESSSITRPARTRQPVGDTYNADSAADVLDEVSELLAEGDIEIPTEITVRDGEQSVITRSARAEMQALQDNLDALDALDTCRKS